MQSGSKVVGTGGLPPSDQGVAVAISNDGRTALVGALRDNGLGGAAWVFVRSGETWTQQGDKLVASTAAGKAAQGIQVALSADGNTALIGGSSDANSTGAAWVFTRSGGVWTQQAKLVAFNAIGSALQGFRVALSGDGNTALVAGPRDDSNLGATWVYVRNNNTWSAQTKLIGRGNVGSSQQGWSVALSNDGTTALIGAPSDNNGRGAAWVFTRNGSIWSQQGDKLVGMGSTATAWQGNSVALSADGNTALLQGPADNGYTGAAWVFKRSNGVWMQDGPKFLGGGALVQAQSVSQGHSAALSADGSIAAFGWAGDSMNTGAVWVFNRGANGWTQSGSKLVGSGSAGAAWQGYSVALSGDGRTLIEGGPLDNNRTGAVWFFNATSDGPPPSTGGSAPSVMAAGVVNAASFDQAATVAPGEIVTIFGKGMGPMTYATLQIGANSRVETFVAQTRVLFDGVAAPII